MLNFIKELPSGIKWRIIGFKFYLIGKLFRSFPNLATNYIENKIFKLICLIITGNFNKNIDYFLKESKRIYILMNLMGDKLDFMKLFQLMINKHKIITPIRVPSRCIKENVDYTSTDYFQQIVNYYADKENHLDDYLNKPIDICFVFPVIMNIDPNDIYSLKQMVYIANDDILDIVDIDETLFSSYTKLYESLPEEYRNRYTIQCKIKELDKLINEYHDIIDKCNYNDCDVDNQNKILEAGRKIYDYLEENMDEYNGYYFINVIQNYVDNYLNKGNLLGYSKVDKLGKKKVEFGYYISTPFLFIDDNNILSTICLRYFNKNNIDVENEDIEKIDCTELMMGVTNHISILINEYGDLLDLLDIDEDDVENNQSYMYIIDEKNFKENFPHTNLVGKNPSIVVIADEDYRDNERLEILNYLSVMYPIRFKYFKNKSLLLKSSKNNKKMDIKFTDDDFKSIEMGMHGLLDTKENKDIANNNKNNIIKKDNDSDDDKLQPV